MSTKLSIKDRISFKMGVAFIVVALILGLILSTIQFVSDFNRTEKGLRSAVNVMLKVAERPVSKATYSLDNELSKDLLKGLFESGYVVEAWIVDEQGSIFSSHKMEDRFLSIGVLKPFVDKPLETFSISLDSQSIALGELHIKVNRAIAYAPFLDQLLFSIVSGMMGILGMVLLLLYVFYAQVGKPLSMVTEYIGKLQPDDPTTKGIPLFKSHLTDEIGLLIITMNTYIAEIAKTLTGRIKAEEKLSQLNAELEQRVDERTAELQNTNNELQREVSERKKAEENMRHAQIQAEEASKAKSEFLANMSHEIRTPLNAILGMLHLTLKTEMTNKQVGYLSKIDLASKNLLHIINDILDFSKIEAGKLEFESREFELGDVLEHLSALAAVKAQEKGLEFVFHVDRNVKTQLIGDPLRLGQVLLNLCQNAIKFTESGEVVVSVSALEAEQDDDLQTILQFSVRDTGIGLSHEQKAKLFQAFTQADGSTTRKYGGTGLGLTICKRLVNMMHGDIGVDSEPNVGSNFYFTARLKTQSQTKPVSRFISPDIQSLRVLVVDDNETARDTLAEILSSFLLSVSRVASASDAYDVLQKADEEAPFDLVLMDWSMPDIDGIAASRYIKYNAGLKHVPIIIMVTAYGREDVMRQAEEVPLDGFLLKPVGSSVLFNALVNAVKLIQGVNVDDTIVKHEASQEMTLSFVDTDVLLVEDNDLNQLVAKELLDIVGINVHLASNGKEALFAVENMNYDAVLMDAQMPVMDGYEATRNIRANPSYKKLPIIAMTANALKGDREKCLAAGMDDYISKPIDPKQLYRVLNHWVGKTVEVPLIKLSEAQSEFSGNQEQHERAGINVVSGLAHVSGNETLYRNLLVKFRHKALSFEHRFNDLLLSDESEAALRLVHTLKGNAGTLGADSVYKKAESLESILKQTPEANADIQTHVDALLKQMKPLTYYIDSLEPHVASLSPPVAMGALSKVTEIIDKLATLLEEDDTAAMRCFKELKECNNGLISLPDIIGLEKNVTNYDFERALVVLKGIRLKVDGTSNKT